MLLDSLHEHCSVSRASFISETFQGSLRNEVSTTAKPYVLFVGCVFHK